MMPWIAHRLVYRAKSPVHIGWHTLGYIKRTRPYIPGRAMWGAMAANLTRALGTGPGDYGFYGQQLLNKKAIASYFFPAIDPNRPLLPEYGPECLVYGDFYETEFDAFFIRSFGQTAVMPDSQTAEDESLHESDFIAPTVRFTDSGETHPVFFVGYLFVSNENQKPALQPAEINQCLSEIFIGGDRKYGWGRLVLDRPLSTENDGFFFGHQLVPNTDRVMVDLDPRKPIPAHMKMGYASVRGDIEPLVGLEWDLKMGPGQKTSSMELCWSPGSKLEGKLNHPVSLQPYGILGS